MRHTIAVIVAGLGFAWHGLCAAQDYVDVVAHYVVSVVPGQGSLVREVKCPPGYVPLYVLVPTPSTSSWGVEQILIDSGGQVLSPLRANPGGGYRVTLTSSSAEGGTFLSGEILLRCAREDVVSLSSGSREIVVEPGQPAIVDGTCPAPQTAVGFASNVDGVNLRQEVRAYFFGTRPNFVPLNNVSDGEHPVPGTTALVVRNMTSERRTLDIASICAQLPPGAKTLVASVPVIAGQPHVAHAPVPDGYELVGDAFTVSGAEDDDNLIVVWTRRGVSYDGLPEPIFSVRRGTWLEGRGASPGMTKQQVVGRAVIGSILVPSSTPVPPPTIVTIVEFYNAALDHYFITANAQEISDLDGGVHPGWQRTGETFNAYGVGSSGRTGRRPVCRAYGNPAAGLDSHFYSASPQECRATINNFGDDWLLEATEVFEIELPDTTTGECPADRVAIYRLWNGRADSSHRFVKTLALRAQMIARGFVPEGYGENGVVFCALP